VLISDSTAQANAFSLIGNPSNFDTSQPSDYITNGVRDKPVGSKPPNIHQTLLTPDIRSKTESVETTLPSKAWASAATPASK
jgi:hypothetical protein